MLTLWIVVTIAAIVIEIVTLGNLICLWFAFGGAFAAILAALHFSETLQIVTFFITSVVTMLIIRPLAYNYLRGNTVPTNSDRLIGKSAKLIKPITEDGWGEIKIDGALWSVVTSDNTPINKGEIVKIIAIDGSKLIVIAVN